LFTSSSGGLSPSVAGVSFPFSLTEEQKKKKSKQFFLAARVEFTSRPTALPSFYLGRAHPFSVLNPTVNLYNELLVPFSHVRSARFTSRSSTRFERMNA
jgi:hypothetical protein